MSDWQPISSAPKDGSTIIVLRFCDPFHSMHFAMWEHVRTEINGKLVKDEGRWKEVSRAELGYPISDLTHWMPIPTLPRRPTEPVKTESEG